MPASEQKNPEYKKPKENRSAEKHKDQEPDLHDIHTLLEWDAPGRPFRKHSKQYFINILLITAALEIILFLFAQHLLMVVVLSLVFLSFALAISPPRKFHYRITTEGILVEDHFFIWEELYDFYFWKEHGQEVLHVGTKAFFPGEVLLTLGEEVKIGRAHV